MSGSQVAAAIFSFGSNGSCDGVNFVSSVNALPERLSL